MQNNIMLSLFTFNLKFLLKNIKFKFIFFVVLISCQSWELNYKGQWLLKITE